jgi:CheY-like chemotaxis protein
MTKAQILIVQDDPADIDLLRLALEQHREPYDLTILRDGAEALQFVTDRRWGIQEPHPCVILLNLYLPKYDGMEVLEAVRRAPNLGHVQVVMLTSTRVPPWEGAKIENMGAFLWQKPLDFSEVLEFTGFVLQLCKTFQTVSWFACPAASAAYSRESMSFSGHDSRDR